MKTLGIANIWSFWSTTERDFIWLTLDVLVLETSSTRNYSEHVGKPPWIFKLLGYTKILIKMLFPSNSLISMWGFCWVLWQFFPHDSGRAILREVSPGVSGEENHHLSLNQVQGLTSVGSVTPCVSTSLEAIPTGTEAVWRERLYLS